jgi:hypothetical protein
MLNLTASDWICASVGGLYAAPFMSRFLLYRLTDFNCSLLLWHEDTVQAKRDLPKGGESVCEVTVNKPTVAHLHFAPFAVADWAGFSRLEPRCIRLQENATEQELNGIIVRVEPWRLDVKQMHALAAGTGHSYPIMETSFSVRSPVALTPIGNAIPPCNTWIECWKVRVRRKTDKQEYHLHSTCDWSLKAAEIDLQWQPRVELHLVRSETGQG